jgi:hypothetical protein
MRYCGREEGGCVEGMGAAEVSGIQGYTWDGNSKWRSAGRCVGTGARGMLLGMGTEFFWTELVIPSFLVLNMLIVEAKD